MVCSRHRKAAYHCAFYALSRKLYAYNFPHDIGENSPHLLRNDCNQKTWPISLYLFVFSRSHSSSSHSLFRLLSLFHSLSSLSYFLFLSHLTFSFSLLFFESLSLSYSLIHWISLSLFLSYFLFHLTFYFLFFEYLSLSLLLSLSSSFSVSFFLSHTHFTFPSISPLALE